MSDNQNLNKARSEKNDEFYTQYPDVEKELSHYASSKQFAGKTVYCNCDDPDRSEFWNYFVDNFENLGLKKLTATCYIGEGHGKYAMFDGNSVIRRELTEDGDFRSDECIEILNQSDVVVTNPPFSLFREFVDCLVGNGLDFLIVGNINAITYKNFFPLLKDDRVWMGYTSLKKFDTPNGESTAIARWFTNLEIKKRSNPIPLTACYYGNEEKYPHYDNYDAINVDRVKDIPGDYFECIGVPITFMEKCCPDQFEIVGCTESEGVGFSNGLFKEKGGGK